MITKIKTPILCLLVVCLSLFLISCSLDDPTPEIIIGDAHIDTEGSIWRFDKAHSNIEWETAYLGELALLTGRFSDFNISLNFDEQDLSASHINAYVRIASNLTGEPGRDRLGGCMQNTLGVLHNGDTLQDGSLDPAGIDSLSNIASFTSTVIAREGSIYHARGNMNFKGESKPVDLYFTFTGIIDRSEAQDGSDLRAGFSGELDMMAKTDFAVVSDNIADLVTIKINCETRLR